MSPTGTSQTSQPNRLMPALRGNVDIFRHGGMSPNDPKQIFGRVNPICVRSRFRPFQNSRLSGYDADSRSWGA